MQMQPLGRMESSLSALLLQPELLHHPAAEQRERLAMIGLPQGVPAAVQAREVTVPARVQLRVIAALAVPAGEPPQTVGEPLQMPQQQRVVQGVMPAGPRQGGHLVVEAQSQVLVPPPATADEPPQMPPQKRAARDVMLAEPRQSGHLVVEARRLCSCESAVP